MKMSWMGMGEKTKVPLVSEHPFVDQEGSGRCPNRIPEVVAFGRGKSQGENLINMKLSKYSTLMNINKERI